MLSKQHQFAASITRKGDRAAYRTHMCGLCHALGDEYGLMSRWLTSHEMILLNMLTTAQRAETPEDVMRRCPLNPMMKVRTNQDSASQFAAAVAVSLAKVSVADDVEDSGDLLSRAANALLHRANRSAAKTLVSLGFDANTIHDLGARQSEAEGDPAADPARPTANTSAGLFAMTAHLAGSPQNEDALAVIGANYGAYLYLMDAYRDFPRDFVSGDYNPLRRYTVNDGASFSLLPGGLSWLLERFEQIETVITQNIALLELQRYADLLPNLLTDPIRHIIKILREKLTAQHPLHFRRWRLGDALKAGLFVVPVAVAGMTSMAQSGGEPHLEAPANMKRRKKRSEVDSDSCWPGVYWCSWGSPDASGCGDCGSACTNPGLCGNTSGGNACICIDDHHGDGAATLCGVLDLNCDGLDGCDGCDGLDGCSGCDGCDSVGSCSS